MTLLRRVFVEQKVWILLVLAGVALNVGACAIVTPLRTTVDAAERRAASLDAQLRQAQAVERRARETLESEVRASADLGRFTGEILPRDQATARRLLHVSLIELAEQHDLSFDRQTLTQSTERDRELTRLDVSVVLVGDYAAVREFVHAIESGDDFLVISELGLSQPRDVDRLVELALRVSTYYKGNDAS